MEVRFDIDSLIQRYVRQVHRDLVNNPAAHQPTYHEFSLAEHLRRVVVAARSLTEMTGVDIETEAHLHDVGKLIQIDKLGRWTREVYYGHEALSARIAQQDFGCSHESCLIIRYHNVSHAHQTRRVLQELCGGDVELLKRLLVLCTADTVGKGWTEKQSLQRPEVAAKFREICRLAAINGDFPVILEEAIRTW